MAKRGRPAGFDRAEALRHAMELFWARGYEGATLGDLQAAMGGISPPSFYHAFGSKEELFKEVAELYALLGLSDRVIKPVSSWSDSLPSD